jgi:hypothetical protein
MDLNNMFKSPVRYNISSNSDDASKRLAVKNIADAIEISQNIHNSNTISCDPHIKQPGKNITIENDKFKYFGTINQQKKPHGKGSIYYKKSGIHFRGNWINGKKEGIGEIIKPDGNGLVVYHNNNNIHGYGYATINGKKSTNIDFFTQTKMNDNDKVKITNYVPSSGEFKDHIHEKYFFLKNPNFYIDHDFVKVGGKKRKTHRVKKSRKSRKSRKSKK